MRRVATALAAAALAALSGCGVGPGPSKVGDGSRLVVTKDYGQSELDSARVTHVHESDTVMRFLQAAHKVTTRYGGGFVQSIDGLAGDRAAQRDWFYYVNGIEADTGAADFSLSPGDRIQWDLHSWRATMRVPAIVGEFPEPFVHGYRGKRYPVRVECEEPDGPACADVVKRLGDAGSTPTQTALGAGSGLDAARVVVGRWGALHRLQAAALLAKGPRESGVFARFAGAGRLELLAPTGAVARVAPAGTGLLAARVPEGQAVTWLVTGVDDAGVARAAAALDESKLKDAFAVAATPSGIVRLPVGPQ